MQLSYATLYSVGGLMYQRDEQGSFSLNILERSLLVEQQQQAWHSMYSNASSPGPGYSPSGTPTKRTTGFLDSLKRALPRADSPASTFDGSELGTPKRGMFPSFTNGQRKREVIKKLEEDTSLLNMQVHQQEQLIGKLQQQLQQEEAARSDAQERLNMQYFKASLVADMLVMKLLDIELGIQPVKERQVKPQAAVAPITGPAGMPAAVVMEESSF